MADTRAFEVTCETLEDSTSLDRLESRGTVRLSLKQAGLGAGEVTADQMRVIVSQVLAGELRARGVEDVDRICERMQQALADVGPEDVGNSPEAVFARLGGA